MVPSKKSEKNMGRFDENDGFVSAVFESCGKLWIILISQLAAIRHYLIHQFKNCPFELWAIIPVADQHSFASHGPHFVNTAMLIILIDKKDNSA